MTLESIHKHEVTNPITVSELYQEIVKILHGYFESVTSANFNSHERHTLPVNGDECANHVLEVIQDKYPDSLSTTIIAALRRVSSFLKDKKYDGILRKAIVSMITYFLRNSESSHNSELSTHRTKKSLYLLRLRRVFAISGILLISTQFASLADPTQLVSEKERVSHRVEVGFDFKKSQDLLFDTIPVDVGQYDQPNIVDPIDSGDVKRSADSEEKEQFDRDKLHTTNVRYEFAEKSRLSPDDAKWQQFSNGTSIPIYNQRDYINEMPGGRGFNYSTSGCGVFSFAHALMLLKNEIVNPLDIGHEFFPNSTEAVPTFKVADMIAKVTGREKINIYSESRTEEKLIDLLESELDVIIIGVIGGDYPLGHTMVGVLDEQGALVIINSDGAITQNFNDFKDTITDVYGIRK